MKLGPFDYQSQGLRRKISVELAKVMDTNNGFVFIVKRMNLLLYISFIFSGRLRFRRRR